MNVSRWCLAFSFLLSPLKVSAGSQAEASPRLLNEIERSRSFYMPERRPDERRNYFLFPLISFVLPSFDQWWEAQYESAAWYTGITVAGVGLASSAEVATTLETAFASEDRAIGVRSLGLNAVSLMGSLSLYHSFRTAVWTQQSVGRFGFLEVEEEPQDLLLAPFDFSHMGNWTTIVPLSIAAALVATVSIVDKRTPYAQYADEFVVGAGQSYVAGTGEEMLFRGWMLPVAFHNFDNFFWSNVLVSSLFAAAHMPNVKVPLVQFIGGYYFSWLTRRRKWSLAESIFIHTWWDVILITSALSIAKARDRDAEIRVNLLNAVF